MIIGLECWIISILAFNLPQENQSNPLFLVLMSFVGFVKPYEEWQNLQS